MACLPRVFPLLLALAMHSAAHADNTSTWSNASDVVVERLNLTHHEEESEFPRDLFTAEQRSQGAILLHCVLAVYCFVAIAKVCTEYFMPTIACICKVLKLSDDVAAATFMSIATSSPELFTNIIGTFITESDIGVGHVLGNAYYDMFFVASLGGLAASQDIVLDWWPITRDCSIYLVVAVTLTWVVWDGQVETYECLILLSLYVLYFVIMFGNHAIIRFLKAKFNITIIDPVEETIGEDNSSGGTSLTTVHAQDEPLHGNGYVIVPTIVPNDPKAETLLETPPPPRIMNTTTLTHTQTSPAGYKRVLTRVGTLLVLPLTVLTAITIPDVRKRRWRKFYPISFVMCVCWIGVSTYLGTWMISTIGKTIGISDIIMGMVFMAAGGSVVEAYGVYYKARRGACSIGLSNSMGCNTLDATMCLALPWLVKSLLYTGVGSSATMLASEVLHVNCVLLVISVLLIYAILYVNSFKLNWKLGLCCGIAYVAVLAIAITIESNQGSHQS